LRGNLAFYREERNREKEKRVSWNLIYGGHYKLPLGMRAAPIAERTEECKS